MQGLRNELDNLTRQIVRTCENGIKDRYFYFEVVWNIGNERGKQTPWFSHIGRSLTSKQLHFMTHKYQIPTSLGDRRQSGIRKKNRPVSISNGSRNQNESQLMIISHIFLSLAQSTSQ